MIEKFFRVIIGLGCMDVLKRHKDNAHEASVSLSETRVELTVGRRVTGWVLEGNSCYMEDANHITCSLCSPNSRLSGLKDEFQIGDYRLSITRCSSGSAEWTQQKRGPNCTRTRPRNCSWTLRGFTLYSILYCLFPARH